MVEGGRDRAPRALLIEAPFEPLRRGRLAPALLKAELQLRGMACDVEHLGQAFAALLGREEYELLAGDVPPEALAPDWVFAEALFGAAVPAPEAYLGDVLRRRCRLSGELADLVLQARRLAAGFLRATLAEIDWSRYVVLAFSAPVGQTVAALALAKAVKARHPCIHIIFGGPAWHGVMGRRQLALFPFVDAACTGDGDLVFPAFCTWVATGSPGPAPRGILLRHGGGVPDGDDGDATVADLDVLPTPDYTDLYSALARRGADAGSVQLGAEASRGCWWGAGRPCAFCGLNGSALRYRQKSAARILTELRELDGRWQPWLIDLVDNVVAPAFLREALPLLAVSPLGARLFFEARPRLTRTEVRLAARSGAHVQLGIESFSQHVLDLVGKGTDVGGNLQQLRWCRDEGVPVTWNLLHDVPGETVGDYRDLRGLLPALRRLPPPESRGPVEVQRFSRYLSKPADHGFVNVRPAVAYRYVYPYGPAVLGDIAYLFDADHAADSPVALERERAAFLREVDEWMAASSGEDGSGPASGRLGHQG
jgi:ribosomal peptide maturation radical SAM protein 1